LQLEVASLRHASYGIFGVAATIRASFAFYNTKAEIDNLFKALIKVQEVFK